MRYAFHPEARLEYLDAATSYAAARPDLGAKFTREIEPALALMCHTPERWRTLEQDVRCCRTKRFPYTLLYTLEEDYLRIVAVMHGSRQPGYWRHRVKPGA